MASSPASPHWEDFPSRSVKPTVLGWVPPEANPEIRRCVQTVDSGRDLGSVVRGVGKGGKREGSQYRIR